MKKYWKSTLIVAVIVLAIGTFYINSAMSASEYPEFVMKKQSGSASMVNPMILKGQYHNGVPRNFVYTSVKVTSDGAEYREYRNNPTLLEQITGIKSPMIQELQDEYRSFMRGKGTMVNTFFESDQYVAYGDVNYKFDQSKSSDFTFSVAVLNKSDNQKTSFTIAVPHSSEINHMRVEDVRVIDHKLYIITQNFTINKDIFTEEKHLYTIEIESERLVGNDTIFSNTEQQGSSQTITGIHIIKTTTDQPYQHAVFVKTKEEFLEEQRRPIETVQEINVYNLVTGEMEKLVLPAELKESQVRLFDGSRLYFASYDEQTLVITQYNIKDKEIENVFKVDMANDIDGRIPPLLSIKGEKLYVATQLVNLNTTASLMVVNINTGKTLYTGEIVREDAEKNTEQFELNLYEILIK